MIVTLINREKWRKAMSRRIRELTKADREALVEDGLCLHAIDMDDEPCFEDMTKEEKNRALAVAKELHPPL